MTPLLLGILLLEPDGGRSSWSPDAGTRWEAPLYELCPPAPPNVVLDGGWRLMSPERAERIDCLMVTADERVKQLEASPPFLSQSSLLFAGIMSGLALLAGVYFGFQLGRWWPF